MIFLRKIFLGFFLVAICAEINVAFAWNNPSSNPTSGAGAFYAEPSTPANALYIKSNGYLGIGSSNPADVLYINAVANSGINMGGVFKVRHSVSINNIVLDHTATTGDLYIRSDSDAGALDTGNIIINDLGGNVGIGGAATSQKLYVVGDATIAGTMTATAFSGPVSGTLSAGNVSAGAFGSNTGGGNYTFPGTLGVSGNTTVTGGDLIINTTAAQSYPDLRLQGAGTEVIARNDGARLWLMPATTGSMRVNIADAYDNDRGVSLTYVPGSPAATPTGYLEIGQTQKNHATYYSHGITKLFTNGAERLRIDASGNVGIATSTPQNKLQVNGGTGIARYDTINIRTNDNNNAGGYMLWSGGDNSSQARIGTIVTSGYNADLTFETHSGATPSVGTTEVMRLKSDGNVGIGTTTPTQKLDVVGTVKATAFEGGLTGTVSAGNISAGAFGSNTGGGNYSFPANVGIGTTSPTSKLSVIASTAFDQFSIINSDYYAGGWARGADMQFKKSAGTYHRGLAYGLYGIGDTFYGSYFSAIEDSASPWSSAQLFLKQDGNVGIGTTAPTQTLEVAGSIKATNSIYASNIQGQKTTGEFDILANTNSSNGPSIEMYGSSHATSSGVMNIISHSAGSANGSIRLIDYNGSSWDTNVLVDKNGNVGIGTTSPTQKLEVNGATKLLTLSQGAGTNERFYPNVISSAQNSTVSGAWIINTPIPRASNHMFKIRVSGYAFNVQDSIDFTIVGYPRSTASGNIDGALGAVINYDLQDNGTDGLKKYVGINSAGNVAIALGDETLSAYYYRVSVDAWITLTTTDYSTGWSVTQSAVSNFGFLDIKGPLTSSLKNTVFINSTGNVGIGTTTPTQKLDVVGTVKATAFEGGLTGTVSAGNISAGAFGSNTGGGNYSFPANVGIGTVTPQSKLQVNGGTGVARYDTVNIRTNDNNNAGGYLLWSGADNSNQARIGTIITSGYNADLTFETHSGATPSVNTAEVMRLKANGDVGIGTATPTRKLDVVGTVKATSFEGGLTGTVSAGNVSAGAFGSNTGGGNYSFPANLGIGTASPSKNLELYSDTTNGAIKEQIKINGGTQSIVASGSGQTIGFANSTAYYGMVGGYGNGTTTGMGIWNGTNSGAPALYLTGGNLGVGVTSPAYKLDVVSGGAVTARLGSSSLDTVFIGGGAGKLNVGTIDPIYTIDNKRYATYTSAMTGVKEETAGVLKLDKADSLYQGVIDFGRAEAGSDLWLFYQVTDFGDAWNNLSILLSSDSSSNLWYKKDVSNKKIYFYSDEDKALSQEVSYRLTAPRFDHQKWGNDSHDEVDGFILNSKK